MPARRDYLVALGANLGERRRALVNAVEALRAAGVELVEASPLYESPALAAPEDTPPPFLNAVLHLRGPKNPYRMHALCRWIERGAGRRPGPRNAARTLDLDLVAALGLSVTSPELSLPHPRLWGRDFVLRPLAALALARRFFPAGPPPGRGWPVRRIAGPSWIAAGRAAG